MNKMKRVNNRYRDPKKYLIAIFYSPIPTGFGNGNFLKYHGIRNNPREISIFERNIKAKWPTVTKVNYYPGDGKGECLYQKEIV